MPYYDTIEEDLTRAKEILAKGRAADDPPLPPAVRGWLEHGGTIYGADIYAAYKLLESFVAEIERPCPEFRPDHNGECLNCDEWLDTHTPEAIQAGEDRRATIRTVVGQIITRTTFAARATSAGPEWQKHLEDEFTAILLTLTERRRE